jgi:thioredoxin-like negative regulator of GroEL
MEARTAAAAARSTSPTLPTLVFAWGRKSGASRKMESLVAWVKVTQKRRLRVVDLDVDSTPELADRLGVREVPTLLVLEEGEIVDRLEGRATGRQIDALIRPHLGA